MVVPVRKVVGKARLSRKNQIVVPVVVRVLLDLEPGSVVQFILEDGRIYIEKGNGG